MDGVIGILENIIKPRYFILYWSFVLYTDVFSLLRYHKALSVDISSYKLNIININTIYFIFGFPLVYLTVFYIIDTPLGCLVYKTKGLLDWIRNLPDKIYVIIINKIRHAANNYKNHEDDSAYPTYWSNQSVSNNPKLQIFKNAEKVTFILSFIDYYLSFKFQTKSLLSSIFKLIPHYYNFISIIYLIVISLILWDSYNF